MKKLIVTAITCLAVCSASQTFAQPTSSISDTTKRAPIASPRDSVITTTSKGTTITVTYGSPAIKGRTMGTDLEPREDSVWRAGANEATTFEVNKDVTIEGKKLPAGKYALFTKKHGSSWTFIFNKTWKTWGAYSYKENKAQDALQVTAMQSKGTSYNERLKYVVSSEGKVQLLWGNIDVAFTVK